MTRKPTRRDVLKQGAIAGGALFVGGAAVGTATARGGRAVAYTFIPDLAKGDEITINGPPEEDVIRRCEGKNGKHKVDRYPAGDPGQNILVLSKSLALSPGDTIEVKKVIQECTQNRAVKFQFSKA